MSWWSRWRGAAAAPRTPASNADVSAADGFLQQAAAALERSDVAAAREALDQALHVAPRSAAALVESARLHLRTGSTAEALRQYDEALLVADEPARIYLELGQAHLAARDLPAAVDAFTMASTLDPMLGDAWLRLGETLGRLDRNAEAVEALAQAVSMPPGSSSAGTWFQYGQCLHNLRRLPEALDAYQHSLRIEPEAPYVLMAAGHTELLQERDEAALAYYEQALRLADPVPPGLELHLAMAYQNCGRWRDSQRAYERLLTLAPNDHLVRWYLSQCDLALCNWERGWSNYGARFGAGASPYRPLPFRPWRGEAAPDDTLLILADQGLGDEIMFAWCVPDAMARVKHCIVECEPRLERLFRRSFPGVTVIGSDRQNNAQWLKGLPEPQWQIFGGDLPALFRTDEARFAPHTGYLVADPERVAYWRERLATDLGPGRKVGISWRGGSHLTRTRSRSLATEDWAPILGTPGCRFVNLQYGNYLPELADINARFGNVVHDYPEALTDYDETAALVAALDQLVTVCTAIVHLGGSLGRPVWVLVPFSPGWRYTVERDRMPWYPSTRLFRQSSLGDWDAPVRALAAELAAVTQMGS